MTKVRITRRLVNVRRHTKGFVLTGGKSVTRNQAVKMARKGLIRDVRVVRANHRDYLMGTGTSLYSLPVSVDA